MASAPRFPRELERQIFETCALARPCVTPKLMLVAWRIKEWLEPILYRTIVVGFTPIDGYPTFTSEFLLSALESKPPEFFRTSVRNLLLLNVPDFEKILAACSSVENLYIYYTIGWRSVDFSTHQPYTLRHLHIFNDQDLSGPIFMQITHLDVAVVRLDRIDLFYTSLVQLPHLTHTSFYGWRLQSIFLRVLRECLSLKVLLCFQEVAELRDRENLASDPRFVVSPLLENLQVNHGSRAWQMGVHAGLDYWYRAERFIARRRSGEVDRKRFVMSWDDWSL